MIHKEQAEKIERLEKEGTKKDDDSEEESESDADDESSETDEDDEDDEDKILERLLNTKKDRKDKKGKKKGKEKKEDKSTKKDKGKKEERVRHESVHQRSGVKFCHFFNNRGYCKYGSQCEYSHIRAPCCRDDASNSCNRRLCMFTHVNKKFPEAYREDRQNFHQGRRQAQPPGWNQQGNVWANQKVWVGNQGQNQGNSGVWGRNLEAPRLQPQPWIQQPNQGRM